MYISLNWLRDYVNIPRSLTPEELGLKLTMHTVEIDAVMKEADKYQGVVVGRVQEIKNHPNADKLKLVKVDIGEKLLEVVCGADNYKVSDMVPVAMVGTTLPNGVELQAAKIRGISSAGMMCAEDELNLGEDHSGIMILGDGAKVGQPFGEYLKLKDVVFEVDNKSITNRPDLWGHYGMAREIAAFLNTKLKKDLIKKKVKDLKIKNKTSVLQVKVEDFDKCPRYMAAVMEGIQVTDSPDWLQARLITVGVRPINNIVDITNYVMLETGQPLHAFDFKLVEAIVVRNAKEGESVVSLDREERELTSEDIVIADKTKPIAIAGVMGGENSEISNETTTIIIESANFDPVAVRKTAQRLDLRTEASKRFEKSLDPNLCEQALVRTVELIQEVSKKCRLVGEIKDEKKYSLDQGPIELSFKWLQIRIGEDIEESKAIKILDSLGFAVLKEGDKIKVKVPTWRATEDVSLKEDIMEEVARIIGYDNITPTMPRVDMKAPLKHGEKQLNRRIREALNGTPALTEVYNYSFVGEEQLKKLGLDCSVHLKLKNPIAEQYALLRQNLAPNLIQNTKTNQARYEEIRLFELGSVYSNIEGSVFKDDKREEKLPYQEKRLGILITDKNKDETFSGAKGIITHLFARFDTEVRYESTESTINWADDSSTAQIIVDSEVMGYVYAVSKAARQQLGIKKQVAIAEISLNAFHKTIQGMGDKEFKEFAKYPPLVRDLAFVAPEKIEYNEIKEAISKHHEYIASVELFDVFRGGKLGKNKKNLAFHIVYQAEKTLKGKEVDEIQGELVNKLKEKFDAQIRNF